MINTPKNVVRLAGILEYPFEYNHTTSGISFFRSKLSVERISGAQDHIPITISEYLLPESFEEGTFVAISGSLRSIHSLGEDGNYHLDIYVFADSIKETNPHYVNQVDLNGYLFSTSHVRETAVSRRYLTDFMLLAHKPARKLCRIPCIAWGSTAFAVSNMDPWDEVELCGRLQSREYTKDGEIREIVELSAQNVW